MRRHTSNLTSRRRFQSQTCQCTPHSLARIQLEREAASCEAVVEVEDEDEDEDDDLVASALAEPSAAEAVLAAGVAVVSASGVADTMFACAWHARSNARTVLLPFSACIAPRLVALQRVNTFLERRFVLWSATSSPSHPISHPMSTPWSLVSLRCHCSSYMRTYISALRCTQSSSTLTPFALSRSSSCIVEAGRNLSKVAGAHGRTSSSKPPGARTRSHSRRAWGWATKVSTLVSTLLYEHAPTFVT